VTCLFRADEEDSAADEAYDNAFEEAVGGGFGAFRLRYCLRRRIRRRQRQPAHPAIEPIYDADSTVFFDIDAKRQDKSDARLCYVLTAMTRDAYISEWNDDDPSVVAERDPPI
jgi:hypothetical protein